MSQQGLVQASIRAITGSAESWEGDWHRLFDLAGIPTGTWNGRLLRWINLQLGTSYASLPEAQQAYASAQGAANWSSMGSIFTPTALGASLLGLWDAERASSLTLSGSSVTTWTDVVGGYALTQGVAGSRPTYGATSFNSRPGVTFDGTDDELTLESVPFPVGSSPCEIWVLSDQTGLPADATTRTAFSYGGTAITDQRRLSRAVVSAADAGRAAVGNGSTSFSADNLGSYARRHVGRAVFSSTATRMDLDGVAGTPVAAVPATGTTRVRMGAAANTTAAAFWSGVHSLVAVTLPLTNGQAAQMLAYMKARGGIA